MVIEHAVGYNFICKSLTRRMGLCWLENAKCYIFEIPPKTQVYFFFFSKNQKQKMYLGNTSSTFLFSFKYAIPKIHLNVIGQVTWTIHE